MIQTVNIADGDTVSIILQTLYKFISEPYSEEFAHKVADRN